jgi:hypothetical protein
VEIHRTVNAVGMVCIGGHYHSIGQQFADRRITLRLETTLDHVVVDGVLVRTIALTSGVLLIRCTHRISNGRNA